MIPPTVGRIVWAWFDTEQKEPYASIITKVISHEKINLTVFYPDSVPEPFVYVNLKQGEDKPEYPYAEWMPYQLGKASKTETNEMKKEV